VYVGSGGNVSFSNASVLRNSAARFGGGLALGGSVGASTCSFAAVDMVLDGNLAQHGASQLNMACNADLEMASSSLALNALGSQVRRLFSAVLQRRGRYHSLGTVGMNG
jgi:hypothetical protein